MQRTLVALGCALTVAASSTFAQQQNQGNATAAPSEAGGPSVTDRARQAAQTIGEKAKEAAAKVKDKAQETAQKARATGDQQTAQQGQGPSPGQGGQTQKQADDAYKAAKAQCGLIQQQAQKTVCEKQAAVTHANAELRIAKAAAAGQGGNTSTMGAGKAAR